MANKSMAVINSKTISWQDCDRVTFEKHYFKGIDDLCNQAKGTAGVRILSEMLGEMEDAHPDWVAEIDDAICEEGCGSSWQFV
jgi:hypothetical protein